jgi:hypothetical protein
VKVEPTQMPEAGRLLLVRLAQEIQEKLRLWLGAEQAIENALAFESGHAYRHVSVGFPPSDGP